MSFLNFNRNNIAFSLRTSVLMLSLVLILAISSISVFAANDDAKDENNTQNPPPYTLDLSESHKIIIDDEEKNIYKKKINIDLNEDAKCTVTDARLLLRIAVKIDEYNGDISYLDMDTDGKCSASDARLLLRYVVKIDVLYAAEDGFIPTDWSKNADGFLMYFTPVGAIKTGFADIGEHTYYFDSKGVMQTGKLDISGKTYEFDDEGRAFNGFVTKEENTYYYEKGIMKTGWLYLGLDMFYFDEDGKQLKNTKYGYFTFDKNGYPSAELVNTETLQWKLRQILKINGATPNAIYNYVHNNYRYKYSDRIALDTMVVDMINNQRGACYHFAYLTQYLLEAAGYECIVLIGNGFNATEHDWVLIKIDGAWRHIDAQKGTFMKTDAEMKALGYTWNYSAYPAAK